MGRAAIFQGTGAVWNALFGNRAEAQRSAAAALSLFRSRDVDYGPAFALALLHDSALYTGTHFEASGGLGYRVILHGTGGTYQKVTAVNGTTGDLTLSGAVTAFTIPVSPLSGVLFFEDRVWIDGDYSVPVTVVSSATSVDNTNGGIGGDKGNSPYANSAFFIVGNLMPSDVNSTAVCGLVSPGDLSIPIWYDSITRAFGQFNSPQMTIWAAMISQDGTLHCDNNGPGRVEDLYVCGSRTGQQAGNFSGVVKSVMDYDERLERQSPPLFPIIRDGSMTVDSWIEN